MRNEEFLKYMVEVSVKQEDHNDFYELAEKYGFLAPWSSKIEDECVLEGCSIIG